jgi:hypothetical protein
LQRHGAHEPNDAEQVVRVKVREKNVVNVEGDSVAHHLALRALAAIEQERFSFAEQRDGGHVPFDGWSRSGSAEESET